jgi:P27 family predicted phage terminase small subunit
MRGRKPKPTQLHILHGNPSEKRLPRNEPKPPGDLTDPPDHFSDDQKTAWRYALTNAPPGMLRRIDRGALAVWTVAEDLHRQAVIRQNRIGLLVEAPGGSAIQSPYLPIINRQALIMLKAASELGFSPVARPRIFGGQPGEVPRGPVTREPKGAAVPLEQFLARPPPKVVH